MNNEIEIDYKTIKRDLLGFGLVLVFILLCELIEIIVENVILEYILWVLDLSTLGVLLCYHFSWITDTKELVYFFLFALFCGILIPLFTIIHELSHAFTTLFMEEFDFRGIELISPYEGVTYIHVTPNVNIEDLYFNFSILACSGSLGSVLVVGCLNRIINSIKNMKFTYFFPLFMTTLIYIFSELCYWVGGTKLYIDGKIFQENEFAPDAYNFFYYYLLIDGPKIPITPLALQFVLIYLFIIFSIWNTLNFRNRVMNLEKPIKEKIIENKKKLIKTYQPE